MSWGTTFCIASFCCSSLSHSRRTIFVRASTPSGPHWRKVLIVFAKLAERQSNNFVEVSFESFIESRSKIRPVVVLSTLRPLINNVDGKSPLTKLFTNDSEDMALTIFTPDETSPPINFSINSPGFSVISSNDRLCRFLIAPIISAFCGASDNASLRSRKARLCLPF